LRVNAEKRLEALIEYCYHAATTEKSDDMRCVVQRIDRARVTVDEEIISSIGKGLLVFLGIERGDSHGDADFLLEKIIHLRIFEDSQGKMNLSLVETSGEILIVSQFTLLADCRKGRRPSFVSAEEPAEAKRLYDYFVSRARENVDHVGTGEFQAMMKIESVNDGPVTMLLDSKKTFKEKS
jgi:D-aminoacyl-tRNA deacylase